MKLVAKRPVRIAGRDFAKGDEVPIALIGSDSKINQLIGQRILDAVDGIKPAYVALRAMTIRKRPYKRGDRIRSKDLTPAKIAQLLELRYLEPAAAQ